MSTMTETTLAKGERLKCDKCAMEIEIIEECGCDGMQPQFICCGQAMTSTGQTLVAQTKEAFVDEVQKRMDDTKNTVAWLQEKASRAKDSAKEQASREADAVSQQYDKLRDSLDSVTNASGDAWKDLAKGVSDSWQSFKAACDKAASRYR